MINREILELRQIIQIAKKNPYEIRAQDIFIKLNQAVYYQCIIGYYICDFVPKDRFMVIEIDGSIHDERGVYDETRDKFLYHYGFDVFRIPNNEVTETIIRFCLRQREKIDHLLIDEAIKKSQLETVGEIMV